MKYSYTSHLSNDEITDQMRRRLPTSGYCIIFGPPQHTYGFSGLHAIFLDPDGNIRYDFDYTESHDTYQRTYPSRLTLYNLSSADAALRYLEDCNFIAGMYNDAYGSSEVKGELTSNTWYTFSESQIKAICK